MEAQLRAMETIETSEVLEIVVETKAQAGVSGMSVAGGGRGGLFVADVLKDSPAAKALRLQEGDQLLSARVFFDDIKYEDALQILKCVEPYKVSFWLKRTVPGVDIARKPGTSTFEMKGPKAKLAKLNIRSLTPLQKKKRTKRKVVKGPREVQVADSGELELAPLDVEFSLPKFSRLRKAKSTGEVAVAEPSPDLSPRPSSLETKRRRLKFPRLKVKDVAAAAAARAEGRLEVGLPRAAMGAKPAGRGESEGKPSRFMVPFPKKSKKPREEAGVGFQAPQVEVDLPLARARPGREPPKGEGLQVQAPLSSLPKVEVVLPTVGAGELEGPASAPQAGLRLPSAAVAAPKVDVDLSLPKWEGAAPEVSLKGEGFRIQIPKFGVSAGEVEGKLPAVEVALGKGRGAADGVEEPSRLGVALPALEVEAPSVDVELPLPKGKADSELPKPRVEAPEVSVKVPTISLPKLGAKCQEELESKLPQVELGVGKPEGPKAKAPTVPSLGLGVSLLESKATVAAAGKAAPPTGRRVPALDLSVPRVAAMQIPKSGVELAAPELGAKVEVAAEEPGFKLHVPQVTLPTFDLAVKTAPPPPPTHAKEPKPGGDVCVSVDVPKLDLSLPAVTVPTLPLPKSHLPRPELGIAVERPAVEVAVPSPRLSFPSAAVPTLDVDVPRVGVELGLPKTGGRFEVEKKMPSLETLGKELEISVPPCGVGRPELEPSGGVIEGLGVSEVVAKIPKVALALGKEQPGTEGVEGRQLPKVGLEMETPTVGAKLKLPSVEIPAVKHPDVTIGGDKPLEAEAKLKPPKFALPKFSISGPKGRKGSPEAEAPETADRAAKLKMPRFGISFPKARRGVEAEGPGGRAAVDPALSEGGLKFPSVELPGVSIGVPEGRAELSTEEGLGIDLPEIDMKVPKVSLPKFGGKGREGDQELQAGEAHLRGSKEGLAVELGVTAPKKEAMAKVPKFKMPSFGIARRDAGEVPGVEVSAKSKKPQGPLGKLMPPKAEAGKEKGGLHIQTPELSGRVPQVELPKFSSSSRRAEAGLAVGGTEGPGLQVNVPLLDLAMPGARAEGELALERPGVGVSEAGIRGYEGELRMPRVPALGVSAPQVELDISLPVIGPEITVPQGAIGADAKIRLPKVELPMFGKGEEEGLEAEVQLLGGRQLSLGREGTKEAEGGAEGSLLGAKIRVPKVDLSLPKTRLSDVELPLTQGEAVVEGPEGKFKMPSVGLPKFSAPRVKGPELELDVSKGKVSSPAIRLPKLGGSSSDGEGEAERDLPRLPQLELKAPKLRGSPEGLGTEAGVREAKSKGPSGLVGFGKAEAEATTGAEDSKFKLKIPSLSLSKAGPESGMDTQPLCPSTEGPDFAFKMPQLALPDVGFSVEQAGKKDAKGGAGALAGMANLEVDLSGIESVLKVPKINVPTLGGLGPKGDTGTTAPSPGRRGSGGAELEGPRGAFRVPGVELSAPSLTVQAEYDVEGAQLQHGSSCELEGAGKRSPGGKAGATDEGRKYRVKLPKFGLALPRAGLEAGEGALGQEAEAKGKRPVFVLTRSKGRGTEGSSGLLEEDGDGKGVMAKLKLRPSFGLSLSKPKMGAEVNGELEEGGPSRLKVPKLGFSKAEGDSQPNGEGAEAASALQNGAQDTKTKLGKIRLPQVELSSPAIGSEMDPELNLNLVRAEEAKEEAPSRTGPFSPLKAPKFRAPKISFSGLKKRNGEAAPAETGDTAALGEKASRFRFPKLMLSPKPHHGTLEITSEGGEGMGGDTEGLKLKLPSVGFSEEPGLEKQVLAVGGGPIRAVGTGEGEATATV
ncbi:periaxin isoform X2 [Tiliqua scincoides]|uniref:periaxin isoform X2 n=1 Tax=Tiliqua scincoides TaxID=71010 RepID=UPI003461EDD8